MHEKEFEKQHKSPHFLSYELCLTELVKRCIELKVSILLNEYVVVNTIML